MKYPVSIPGIWPFEEFDYTYHGTSNSILSATVFRTIVAISPFLRRILTYTPSYFHYQIPALDDGFPDLVHIKIVVLPATEIL